ncbi:WAT1-related protein At1g68170-like [Pyrus x bretschneideri]|uniref:WAT1-related protein At1g68170-like n=1 Tax=Pyrus x bretschneideri TaxID=225117 RepID=UPI00202F1339|nr:WAT1-related protein At1g68170-like [Pyrus x bretschneideri]
MCCSTSAVQGLKPVMMMLVVQTAYVGMNIFYKLVAEVGTNFTILIAYRNLFSAALMLPLALTFERKSRPKLTLDILVHGFISGLLGATLTQNFYIESLALTSATYVVACSNLVPVITFIIALCFRIERLALGTHTGRAKVVGTLLCIGGTMLFTFYKGKHIGIWSTHVNLLRNYSHENSRVASLHRHTRTQSLGSFLALCSSTSFASWLIFQTKMTKKYPCQYSSTALMSVMASIQSVAFALCKERDWSQWKLGWDIKLFTAVYSGVVTTGLVLTLTAWCVRMRGPLFVSIFNPLGLLLIALAATFLLNEKLYLGSILGGILIVCGLYMVLWGKSKEMKMMTQQTQQPPLEDQSHSIDMAASPVNSAAICDIAAPSISTPPINRLKGNIEHELVTK